MTSNDDIIIIGGGLGGLFCGALLSKFGHRVTVLEKNAIPGGGLQMFARDGVAFETGMHILGGMRHGGSINRICEFLGLAGKIKLRHTDADCMDSITFLSDGKTYRIPEGREAYTEYLCREFPHESDGIRKYVDKIYSLANEVDLFYMRPGNDSIFMHSEEFMWAADELISHFVTDPRLHDVLAYMNPMYGGMKGHTPAYIHALINVLYINGPDRFEGGSLQMALALKDVIASAGGQVLTRERVTAIDVGNRMVNAVRTETGKVFTAKHYISAIHPCAMLDITTPGAFPKSYRERVRAIPNTYSAFSLYIIFHDNAFPYFNHTLYYQSDYGQIWEHSRFDSDWPRGFMYMTPADAKQGLWASKMIVNCIMDYAQVSQWEHTVTGQRGSEYEQWKARLIEKVLDRLETLHTGFRKTVKSVYASSPLTIRDFYNQKNGALYGLRKDCKNIVFSQVPIHTKVGNLLLTGQNINLHGICGTPLTAINTAEAIVGNNVIVNAINKHFNENCQTADEASVR